MKKYSFHLLIAKKGIHLRTNYEATHNKDYSVVKTFRAGELALFCSIVHAFFWAKTLFLKILSLRE
ncbi:MAG: hypothetical protein LBR10_14615 [Prevotellaceae bacterium]|nr:hypothetical protein [Prevotellaceae bacterium]